MSREFCEEHHSNQARDNGAGGEGQVGLQADWQRIESGKTYMRPKDKIPISKNFCFLLIFRSYTIHVGKRSANTSVKTETDEKAVVIVENGKHFAFGYAALFQIAAIGRHWKSTKKTFVIVTVPL